MDGRLHSKNMAAFSHFTSVCGRDLKPTASCLRQFPALLEICKLWLRALLALVSFVIKTNDITDLTYLFAFYSLRHFQLFCAVRNIFMLILSFYSHLKMTSGRSKLRDFLTLVFILKLKPY